MKHLIIISILIGCGTEPLPPWNKKEITHDFDYIIDEFKEEAEKRDVILPVNPPVTVYFDEILTTDGVCYPGYNAIGLHIVYKKQIKSITKIILYHELFHCLGGLEHDESYLMGPVIRVYKLLISVWDLVLDEQFNRIKNNER